MAEYIDRERTITDLCHTLDLYRSEYEELESTIREIPAADVAPVRHGRWIIGDGDDEFDVKCSVCEWTDIFDVCGIGMVKSIASEMHYCQNCGAKMDLGGDDNG